MANKSQKLKSNISYQNHLKIHYNS